ncbi:hypothetical protein ASE66_09220 [Bosea sp. Root483D1]|nr:hypothetical protein ASE66_09220 [Bosea sp. Root483D1]
MRIESNRLCELEKFCHVNSTLTAFNVGDERLVTTQLPGYVSLVQPGSLPVFCEQFRQPLMSS